MNPDSACALRYGENPDEVCRPLDYNHLEMTKIRPADEDAYRTIADSIREFVEKAPQVIQSRFWRSNPLEVLQVPHGQQELGFQNPSFQFEASNRQHSEGR